jgi:hypothetical protein
MAVRPEGPLIITRWARQDRRSPPALEPGYAKLDERVLPELLAEAAHFGRHVRYYDRSGAEAGHWGQLLAADPAVSLALVATFRFDEHAASIRRQLSRLRSDAPAEARERALRNVDAHLLYLARNVDTWIGSPDEAVAAAFDRWLVPPFRRFTELVSAVERGGLVAEPFALLVYPFRPDWRLSEAEALQIEWEVERFWLDSVAEPIAEAAEAFLAGLETLKAAAWDALDESLARNDHAPQIGLLLSFLKLFGHEQDRLNAILPRLARFYHEERVGAAPRAPRPDRAFLAFTRAVPEGPAPRIAAGHVFEARGEGGPARFAADQALAVTGAKVEELRLWQVGPGRERVGVATLSSPDDSAVAGAFAAGASSLLPQASVGLIVVGRAFRAESGSRRFEVRLELEGVAWPGGAEESGFQRFLESAIRLSVLTDAGWVDLHGVESQASLEAGSASALFRFALAADGPAIAADAPALRFLVDQDSIAGGIAPLAVFAGARVVRVAVALEVEGLEDLDLSTSAGPAHGAAGLAPFGTPAVRGGWLRIAHPALSGGVEQVGLALRWAEPPPHGDGFSGYYRDYVVDLDGIVSRPGAPLFRNDLFRVAIEAGGREAAPDLPLFPGSGSSEPVAPVSEFSINPGPPDDSASPESGSVRLTLTEPSHAFGDLLYPANVLFASQVAAGRVERPDRRHPWIEWLLALLSRIWRTLKRIAGWLRRLPGRAWALFFLTEEAFLPEQEEAPPRGGAPGPEPAPVAGLMPNPPWRPVLADLRLDYRARFELGPDGPSSEDLSVGHWTAPGAPAPAEWRRGVPLLPPLPERSCFELALAGPADPLTLLFLIDEACDTLPVRWLAKADTGSPWAAPEIVEDATLGLTRSGLLTLARAPGRLLCEARGPLPRVRAILADSISVTRIVDDPADPVKPVPAGAIARAAGVKGIASVRQPLGSFGGHGAGDSGEVATRAGERLRHKQRAVLAWDDERIVLDRFPEIDRVRVLPARGRDGARLAGSVLAVVVPVPTSAAPKDGVRPAAASSLLRDVEAELASRAPICATVAAVSPTYAGVDVQARVALAAAGDGARLEEEVRASLSPASQDGLDLPDEAGERDLSAALVRFIRGRPYVLAVADVTARLALGEAAAPWVVPVAGEIAIEVMTLESFGA